MLMAVIEFKLVPPQFINETNASTNKHTQNIQISKARNLLVEY